MNTIVTSIKISTPLHQTLLQQVVSDGYGLRGKNKWILEAIERFLGLPQFIELVDIASEFSCLNKVISMRIPETIADKLEEAVILVRKKIPAIEGVKSNIIRASIMQRLIRP